MIIELRNSSCFLVEVDTSKIIALSTSDVDDYTRIYYGRDRYVVVKGKLGDIKRITNFNLS